MFSWYYIEGILIQSCYTLLIVLGLSILTGYTGMFSFGHAGFVCIGAYVSILCTMAFGLPYWLSLIIAGLAAMLLGAASARSRSTSRATTSASPRSAWARRYG